MTELCDYCLKAINMDDEWVLTPYDENQMMHENCYEKYVQDCIDLGKGYEKIEMAKPE